MIDRNALTKLIEREDGINWWKPELFSENILQHLPSEWRVISTPPAYEENYNCFVFVFGLEHDSDFLGGNNPIQKEFIRHLLENGTLKVIDDVSPEKLVFYENDEGVITHGGLVQGNDVILSKFMWGPTVSHELWDVPSSFGNQVFYTNKPDSSVVKDEYERYRDSGVEIRPIA